MPVGVFKKVLFNGAVLIMALISAALGTLLIIPPIGLALLSFVFLLEVPVYSCFMVFINLIVAALLFPISAAGWMGLVWSYRDLKERGGITSTTSLLIVESLFFAFLALVAEYFLGYILLASFGGV